MKIITEYKENKNFSTTLINFIFEFKCDKEEILEAMKQKVEKENK